VSARLHVLLGQGGVGKTTLAAGLALALSRAGRRVGLLGIDPSGRLRNALGLRELPELPVDVAPGLQAALLRPAASLRRWVAEARGDPALLGNPFFVALADRLAAATDAVAAVRVAEWAEHDAALDDLVVDTAPGLHGLEFLGKPERLLALLHGRLLRWLSQGADRESRRVVRGLSRIAGTSVLVDLVEFTMLIERVAGRLVQRLDHARAWLRGPSTDLMLVCLARPGAADGVRTLAAELRALQLEPGAILLNRALPPSLPLADAPGPFARFVRASLRHQEETLRELPGAIEVPIVEGLDSDGPARIDALERLGAHALQAKGMRPSAAFA
jgi:anion-transporting  ArsA/GET3 family ATPase